MHLCDIFLSLDWGKRAETSRINYYDMENQQQQELDKNLPNSLPIICKPTMENLLIIYRLIQNEAQNILQCNQWWGEKRLEIRQ